MYLRSFLYSAGLVGVFSLSALAQSSAVNAKPAPSTPGSKWVAPHNADGQPDFEGVWSNNNATPMQRPKDLEGRTTLTDEEVTALKVKAKEFFETGGDAEYGDAVFEAVWAAYKANASGPHKRAENGFDGKTGDYNTAWIAERDWDNRTSLITDPADGRIPATTAAAKDRAASNRRNVGAPAGPEDRGLSERCITFGSPRTFAGYDSYYEFAQSRNYVAIALEQIHETRIVPLDGSPHPPASIQTWTGDSRGHWEGDTLVVDTANYKPNAFMGATDKLHTIEKFTRTSPDVIEYQVTIDDPNTWSQPWTFMIPLRHTNEMMYEYACHEGNIAMEDMLKGARREEAEAAAAKK